MRNPNRNVENIKMLEDLLRASSRLPIAPVMGFNMASYWSENFEQNDKTGHACEVTGCLATWIDVFFDDIGEPVLMSRFPPRFLAIEADDEGEAREAFLLGKVSRVLGIDVESAFALCLPADFEMAFHAGIPEAINTLGFLRRNGVVAWTEAARADALGLVIDPALALDRILEPA